MKVFWMSYQAVAIVLQDRSRTKGQQSSGSQEKESDGVGCLTKSTIVRHPDIKWTDAMSFA